MYCQKSHTKQGQQNRAPPHIWSDSRARGVDGKIRSPSPPLGYGGLVTATEADRNDSCDFRGCATQAMGFLLVTTTLPLQALGCHLEPCWRGYTEVLQLTLPAGLVLQTLQPRHQTWEWMSLLQRVLQQPWLQS